MRLRSILRAAGRLPAPDERRLRDLLHDIARYPLGDHVLPARLCTSLATAYEELQRPGRLAFISILSQQDASSKAVNLGCRQVLALEQDARQVAGPLLRAHSELREALIPASERIIERVAQQPNGLRFLMSLRADLLSAMAEQAPLCEQMPPQDRIQGKAQSSVIRSTEDVHSERERWRTLDASLRRQFGLWFDTGTLCLQPTHIQWLAT